MKVIALVAYKNALFCVCIPSPKNREGFASKKIIDTITPCISGKAYLQQVFWKKIAGYCIPANSFGW
jgi:hypothetical protein